MTDGEHMWTGVLVAGLGLAGYDLATRPAPHKPNATTGAPTNTGSPSAPVGGVPDYVRIYIAQRVQAVRDFGEHPQGDSSGKVLPVTTRKYAVIEVCGYWVGEINRLTGLGQGGGFFGGTGVTLLGGPESLGAAGVTGINYRGIVSYDAANDILRGWKRARAAILVALGGQAAEISAADAERFWNAIARLAIDVDVDRARPDFTGLRAAWAALVDSAQELPGRLGRAAADAAATAGSIVAGTAWDLFAGLAFSKFGIGAGLVLAYMFRAELGALAKRVRP